MKFFRKSEAQPEPTAPEVDETPESEPTIRRVSAGDLDHGRVLASLEFPPGPAREAAAAERAAAMPASDDDRAHEYFVLDGLDGSPVGALVLTTDPADTTVVEAWAGVDPVVRRFGMGALLLERATKRAQELGAARLRATSNNQSGYAFLADNGFFAVTTEGDVVTAELTLDA